MIDYFDFEKYEGYEDWQKYLEEIKVKLNNPHIAEDEKERLRKRLSELEALVEKKPKSHQRIVPY